MVVGLEISAADFGKPDVAVLLERDGHQIGQFELAMEEVCSIIVHIGEEYAGCIDAGSVVKAELRGRGDMIACLGFNPERTLVSIEECTATFKYSIEIAYFSK